MVHAEGSQVWGFLIKLDAPEAFFGIQLAEVCCMTEVMRNLIKGRGFIVLLYDGLIQVLRVKAYAEGSIGLTGVCEGRYSLSYKGHQSDNAECDHVIQGLLYFVMVLWVPSSSHSG